MIPPPHVVTIDLYMFSVKRCGSRIQLCSVPLAKIAPKQSEDAAGGVRRLEIVALVEVLWSVALGLSWRFAAFRYAVPLVFKRTTFQPEDIPPLPIEFADSVKHSSAAAVLASLHLVGPDPNKKAVREEGCVSCAFKLLRYPLFSAEAIGSWSVMVAAPVQCMNWCTSCYVSEKQMCSIRAWVLTWPQSCARVKSRSLALVVFTGVFIPQLRSLWKCMHVSDSGVV